jgi:hypothetical protein
MFQFLIDLLVKDVYYNSSLNCLQLTLYNIVPVKLIEFIS